MPFVSAWRWKLAQLALVPDWEGGKNENYNTGSREN